MKNKLKYIEKHILELLKKEMPLEKWESCMRVTNSTETDEDETITCSAGTLYINSSNCLYMIRITIEEHSENDRADDLVYIKLTFADGEWTVESTHHYYPNTTKESVLKQFKALHKTVDALYNGDRIKR